MLFGSDVKKQFFQKRIKGRGYCDVGTSVISEFYTPLVPKGHDFLQTIGSLAQARHHFRTTFSTNFCQCITHLSGRVVADETYHVRRKRRSTGAPAEE